jgi:putative flippase GtrA
LIDRVGRALAGHAAEILFVDDSDDETPTAVLDAARTAEMRVRLLHREGAQRTGGLGGAVLAGIRATDAAWVVVMDGDLQHPPEVVPELLHKGEKLDIVVASRYCGGGAAEGLSSRYRELVSSSASAAARLAFPRRLARVSDPLSGFFAVRLAALDATSLRPHGFKILLEILGRSPRMRVGEVAFRFAAREQGESKASWREAARFIRQLLALRVAVPAQWQRLLRFGLVGLSGFLVNLLCLRLLLALPLGWPRPIRDSSTAAAAAQVAILWNFGLTEKWVFAGQDRTGTWRMRLFVFWAMGSVALLLQLPLATAVQAASSVSYLSATAVALAALVVLRFAILDRLLYDGRSNRLPLSATVPAAAGLNTATEEKT